MIVHSILYYRLDNPVVSDAVFDAWGKELASLQEKYPDLAEEVPYQKEAFRGFTGSTGFDLPLDDPIAIATAQQLLARTHSTGPD